jgi:hypothetical protein
VAALAAGADPAGRPLPAAAWMALRRLGWAVTVPDGITVNDRIARMAQEQAGRVLRSASWRAALTAAVMATWPAQPLARTREEWDAVRAAVPGGERLPSSVIRARTRQVLRFLDARGRLPGDLLDLEEPPAAARMLLLSACDRQQAAIERSAADPQRALLRVKLPLRPDPHGYRDWTWVACPVTLPPTVPAGAVLHLPAPDKPHVPGWKWAICPSPRCGWQGDRDQGAWQRIAARGLACQDATVTGRPAATMAIRAITESTEATAVITPQPTGRDRSKTGPTRKRTARPAPRRRGAPSPARPPGRPGQRPEGHAPTGRHLPRAARRNQDVTTTSTPTRRHQPRGAALGAGFHLHLHAHATPPRWETIPEPPGLHRITKLIRDASCRLTRGRRGHGAIR